jgi:hypothetical protein
MVARCRSCDRQLCDLGPWSGTKQPMSGTEGQVPGIKPHGRLSNALSFEHLGDSGARAAFAIARSHRHEGGTEVSGR